MLANAPPACLHSSEVMMDQFSMIESSFLIIKAGANKMNVLKDQAPRSAPMQPAYQVRFRFTDPTRNESPSFLSSPGFRSPG